MELTDNQKMLKAFEIFSRYPESDYVAAEHDVIYAGPPPTEVTPEELELLKSYGWSDSSDEDECFVFFC